jgi:hypothetical protein
MDEVNGVAAPNLVKIIDTITNTEELMFSFTIAGNGQVSVVHSAKQYSGGFGNHGPNHHRILAMVGEMVAAGMPPWQMVPVGGLNEWVSLSDYVVPMREALVAELEVDPPAALATTIAGK